MRNRHRREAGRRADRNSKLWAELEKLDLEYEEIAKHARAALRLRSRRRKPGSQ